MLSKEGIKKIVGLQHKKIRQKYCQFLVEGSKSIKELLTSDLEIVHCYFLNNENWLYNIKNKTQIMETEMKKITTHSSIPDALAIVKIPNFNFNNHFKGNAIALDQIQDPGNMGTIIRLADWYGVEYVFYNKGCTDPFSPKSVNSSMGSIGRVKLIQKEIEELKTLKNHQIWIADMNGEDIKKTNKSLNIIIVIGNEGNGISEDILKLADKVVKISRVGKAESLNAAISCGILLDNLI